ncbi:NS3 [Green River chinook virus]|uniref:NS3 n=1 Tax=Green River chinook virus TaxID=1382300 RepID=W6EJ82_9REOV|nr:NS3 [Green River chinook virus]AHJ14810.1 NS3 [Green River chinook virus]
MASNSLINLHELAHQLSKLQIKPNVTFATTEDVASVRRALTRHAADPLAHEHTANGPSPATPYYPPPSCTRYRLCAVPAVSHISGGRASHVSMPTRILVDVTPGTIMLQTPTWDFNTADPLTPGGKMFIKIEKGHWHNLDTGAFDLAAYQLLLDVGRRHATSNVTMKWYGGLGPSRSDLRATGYRARVHVTDNMIMFELPGVDSAGEYPDLTAWGTFAVFE